MLTYAQVMEKAAAWDPYDDEPEEGHEDEGGDEVAGRYEPGTVGSWCCATWRGTGSTAAPTTACAT